MITNKQEQTSNRLVEVCQRLRGDGSRITPQRLAIIELVFESRDHPTALDVYEALRGRFPTMSLTTVYKTLHLLEDLGEVAVVAADPERAHYDGATREPHVHLVCSECGHIADASMEHPDWLRPAEESGWRIIHWRLELVGICPRCETARG